MLKHVNSSEFREMVENKQDFIVDFYADWCGPCKMMAPIFEDFADKYNDKVFCKVNVDEAGDIAAAYGVMSIPMFMIFKEGQPIKKQLGVMSEDDFMKFIF
jgi:thioredoxin 1